MKLNRIIKPLADEKGVMLVVGILLVAVLAILGTTALLNSTTDLKISGNYRSGEEVLYAAEAGAEYGVNRLRAALKVLNGSTSSVVPPTMSGFSFTTSGFLAKVGTETQKTVTKGDYAGLMAYCQNYTITSTAAKNNTNSRATVIYNMEDQLIPLFQFGIFYEQDLEMLPGANMTFSGGRIHSNSDMYMYSSATLTINTRVTAAGDIYHGRKDSTVSPGTNNVMIANSSGTLKGLNFDSSSSTWKEDATSTWGGTVKSEDHGITSLNMPLSTSSSNPIDILGTTDSSSLHAQSGLRIIDGTAYDKSGNVLDLTAGGTYTNPITVTSSDFTDQRESKVMSTVQVDVSVLASNPVAMAALNDPPTGCDSGILYVSSDNITNPAVRLINGSSLPTGGLSVATNNPLYIQGDYNTDNKAAAVFSDALTVLSNSWNDTNSASGISSRPATATTVNTAVVTGNVATAGSNYSGGVENLIRFLENWSGQTFTYGGSLACLWQSQQATTKWPGTGSVYNAPTRNWSYNISLSNLPPGTPRVRNLEKISWRQVTN
ncbi:PilX N-terminal [Syntrophus gentianae]|uniref:PilX N-terminal n=1 Tax=Syntrophus gentianae TaxID=43775 RepID=A0A1H7Z3Z5_9BACT|nr:pilus assembly PilX N-terminal domain-containing protein [Syntrophus gentianae]SEM52901.1 PilX N-terminal [Syntrophus gentianae]